MFIDTARLYLKAGDGGSGCNSFEKDQAGRKIRHNGGPGGRGGGIILRVDENVHTLLDFQYRQHFEGGHGGQGSSNNKTGGTGKDFFIKIPRGTIVKDFATGVILADLVKPGESFLICRGGEGGSGNSRNRLAGEGSSGEEKKILLELKLLAEAGIVGYPNAGKSTLLSKISRARPKIADYPFTTKEPILGVVKYKDFEFVVADIPGLIEGAHLGKGLGDRFLKHVERTKVLIHLIDMSGFSQREPVSDYRKLNRELRLYSQVLAKKPQVIAANKMDIGNEARANLKKFKASFKTKRIVPISALNAQGLEELLKEVARVLSSVRKQNAEK